MINLLFQKVNFKEISSEEDIKNKTIPEESEKNWSEKSVKSKFFTIYGYPFKIMRELTIPCCTET